MTDKIEIKRVELVIRAHRKKIDQLVVKSFETSRAMELKLEMTAARVAREQGYRLQCASSVLNDLLDEFDKIKHEDE